MKTKRQCHHHRRNDQSDDCAAIRCPQSRTLSARTRRRRRWQITCCFYCLIVLCCWNDAFADDNGDDEDPTPSPVRIPDTIPPSPTATTTTPPPPPPPPTPVATAPTPAPPTEAPTTETMTPPPTQAPPTEPPTDSPTEPPTEPPTKEPTATPTEPPTTASPTVAPTDLPTTSAPTGSPTPLPSLMPSWEPSPEPTPLPSLSPSSLPSFATLMPTSSPAPSTPFPTNEPSDQPSIQPSNMPTFAPSRPPSSRPSSSPSLPLQEDLVEVFMYLENANVLQGTSIRTFDRITTRFIKAELESTPEPPMQDLIVWTNVKNQANVVANTNGDGESRKQRQRRSLRVLQDNASSSSSSPLVIVFDATVEFRSTSTDYNVPELVGGTWDTLEDQEAYIAALQATNDPSFADVTAMRTEINGWTPGGGGGRIMEDDDLMMYIIIGASVGGGLLVCLLGVGVVYCRRRRRTKTLHTSAAPTHATTTLPTSRNGERISTEIVVDYQDDISTLGDPMYGAGGMLIPGLEKDETIAASSFVSGDYEYTKAYRGGAAAAAESAPVSVCTDSVSKRTGFAMDDSERGSSSVLDIGQGEDPFFMDDSSFEEQYHDGELVVNVTAPAGKLGMVIDTPSGGVPIVHAIKESSVLAGQVKVGDRLLYVDGEDCSTMTAMQVSKLISERAENPSRAFVFSRPRGRIMSKD